jgi:hypothetical protein
MQVLRPAEARAALRMTGSFEQPTCELEVPSKPVDIRFRVLTSLRKYDILLQSMGVEFVCTHFVRLAILIASGSGNQGPQHVPS